MNNLKIGSILLKSTYTCKKKQTYIRYLHRYYKHNHTDTHISLCTNNFDEDGNILFHAYAYMHTYPVQYIIENLEPTQQRATN